jgi:hypothetical protein
MYYVHIYSAFIKCWFKEGKTNINQIMFNWTLQLHYCHYVYESEIS